MMLKADTAHAVRECQQKIVMRVVVRSVKFVRLLHKRAMRGQLFGFGFKEIRPIREDILANRRRTSWIQIDLLEIASSEHR